MGYPTIFGATSQLGSAVGATLTAIGSTCIYPYRGSSSLWDDKFKEIKPTADLGNKAYVNLKDFTNPDELRHVGGVRQFAGQVRVQPMRDR